jgi:hypothetical protein
MLLTRAGEALQLQRPSQFSKFQGAIDEITFNHQALIFGLAIGESWSDPVS